MSESRTSISAKVITDSTHNGSRLTSKEVTFPRFILPEFNTHCRISKNSASSRAIPVWKGLVKIVESPFIPSKFGKNRPGMQSSESISNENMEIARNTWLVGRDVSLLQAYALAGGRDQIMKDSKENPRAYDVCYLIEELGKEYPDVMKKIKNLSVGVHKQHANRVLEPYAWHTVVLTGTHFRNFYALRASKDAQPEIKELAIQMARAHMESLPKELDYGEWHLPFITEEDRNEVTDEIQLARISSARCARTSYLTHDGIRALSEDLDMAGGLQGNGHTSPFQHPAMVHDPATTFLSSYQSNFSIEWIQYRKMLPNEDDFSRLISKEALLEGMGDQRLVDFVLSLRD